MFLYLSPLHWLTHELFASFQPIPEWTTSNVAEWVTSVNLHRYRDIFKSQGMKGCDLLQLNSEKLKVNVLPRINNCEREEQNFLTLRLFKFLNWRARRNGSVHKFSYISHKQQNHVTDDRFWSYS